MIRVTSTDEKTARRVVATITIDGREYERLRAIADKFNDWHRLGVDDRMDCEDNTAATVFDEFFFCTYALTDDAYDCATFPLKGMDISAPYARVKQIKPETKPEGDAESRNARLIAEMVEAVEDADRRAGERAQ